MSFTVRFFLALLLGVVAAVIISPFAAAAMAALGFHIPFPRIFDRTVMATLFAALFLCARQLGLAGLLSRGFAEPRRNAAWAAAGLGVALIAIAILFALAIFVRGLGAGAVAAAALRASRYIIGALFIAILEEAFFRAFLLGGMRQDFRQSGALVLSAAIYALAHLIRSPAHFYVTGIHLRTGLDNLIASFAQFSAPGPALKTFVGLFLLGIVLGEAFLRTGTTYFSIGLHAGLVIGAKSWPAVAGAHHGAQLPEWLAGPGPVPLISAPAGWILTGALLLLMPPMLDARKTTRDCQRS